MDVNVFSNFISTVGFPIACCIACFWQMNRTQQMHKEEVDKMTEALNNNTKALVELQSKIGG